MSNVAGPDVAEQERAGQPSEAAEASSSGRSMEQWGWDPHGSSNLPAWVATKPCLLWLRAHAGSLSLHGTKVQDTLRAVHRITDLGVEHLESSFLSPGL